MSSTNKTENLKLNSWIGSDKPKRTDFNYDNEVLDKVITEHKEDTVSHVNSDERFRWDNVMYEGTYFGDGQLERKIDTGCPFPARFGIIFANNRPPSIARFSTPQQTNYFGFFSLLACTSGIEFSDDMVTLTVRQTSMPVIEKEYMNFNESGITYHYVMFR